MKRFHPRRIILFGSHARGEARWDSDVDLLVVLDSCDNRRKAMVAMLQALIWYAFGKRRHCYHSRRATSSGRPHRYSTVVRLEGGHAHL